MIDTRVGKLAFCYCIFFCSASSLNFSGHVFTGTNHLFRFNTSFFSGITHNGQCFYSLNYDDVDNQILSELRCRSNKPNHQVEHELVCPIPSRPRITSS